MFWVVLCYLCEFGERSERVEIWLQRIKALIWRGCVGLALQLHFLLSIYLSHPNGVHIKSFFLLFLCVFFFLSLSLSLSLSFTLCGLRLCLLLNGCALKRSHFHPQKAEPFCPLSPSLSLSFSLCQQKVTTLAP